MLQVALLIPSDFTFPFKIIAFYFGQQKHIHLLILFYTNKSKLLYKANLLGKITLYHKWVFLSYSIGLLPCTTLYQNHVNMLCCVEIIHKYLCNKEIARPDFKKEDNRRAEKVMRNLVSLWLVWQSGWEFLSPGRSSAKRVQVKLPWVHHSTVLSPSRLNPSFISAFSPLQTAVVVLYPVSYVEVKILSSVHTTHMNVDFFFKIGHSLFKPDT